MPNKILPNQDYSNIFEIIMEFFTQRLEQFFPPSYYTKLGRSKITVVEIEDDNALAEVAKKTATDRNLLPFFSVRYQSVDENTSGYHPFLSRFVGKTLVNNIGESMQFKFVPVNITVTINFVYNDSYDKRMVTQRWIDSCRMHYLDFDLLVYDNNIRIRVTGEPNITWPDLGLSSDLGAMSTMEMTATIAGYVGSFEKNTILKQVNANIYSVDSVYDPTPITRKTLLDQIIINEKTLKGES